MEWDMCQSLTIIIWLVISMLFIPLTGKHDAEDYKWRKVRRMNQVDMSSLPLQVLFHMCYYEYEMFSVV
jgi:hypothetical protein